MLYTLSNLKTFRIERDRPLKQSFVSKNFSVESMRLIGLANGVLDRFEGLGYRLSLRQLYYQLVAANHIRNTEASYKNLGNLISEARLAGLVDWAMLEDRGRTVKTPNHWDNPKQIFRASAEQFRIDKWYNQLYNVLIMVEKDALSSILDPIARELDLPIIANKGYSSSSTMYSIAQGLNEQYYENDREPVIVYLGDHDPSGLDMSRDVEDRLTLLSELPAGTIEVRRVALNFNQINAWKPPPNPAKITDSRAKKYIDEYGPQSWELDAVDPIRLGGLVRDVIEEYRDLDRWKTAVNEEIVMRTKARLFAEQYQ